MENTGFRLTDIRNNFCSLFSNVHEKDIILYDKQINLSIHRLRYLFSETTTTLTALAGISPSNKNKVTLHDRLVYYIEVRSISSGNSSIEQGVH